MFRFKRLIYSLSFRVNITMFILLIILGWGFTKVTTYLVTRISVASQCYSMSTIVVQAVEDHLLRVENAVKASALTSQAKHLTRANGKVFCDSVCSFADVDSVYINTFHDSQPHVETALHEVWRHGNSMWTEPHRDKHGDVVVTYLTPLQSKRGRTYAILCADMSTRWLADLAKRESTTDSTVITVRSRENIYVYHPDPARVLHKAESQDGTAPQALKSRAPQPPQGEPLNNDLNAENDDKTILNDSPYGGWGAVLLMGCAFGDLGGSAFIDQSLDNTGWDIHCEMSPDDLGGISLVIMGISYFLIFVLFVVMAIVQMIVLRLYLHPLTKIADATEQISQGNFDVELPKVNMHTDIRQLRDSFVRMQRAIKQYIQDLRSTTEQKVSIERDISIAAHIQSGMLPKSFAKRKDIDVYGLLQPAKMVGGDLFDYFVRRSYTGQDGDHEYLFFILGDVSGKGVPAALIMSVVCHLFRNVSRRSTDAARIAGSINASLAERNDENMFCTAFVGVLDLATGHLEYCNAGHNAPIIIRSCRQPHTEVTAEFLASDSFMLPLGVDNSILYTSESMQLDKDDILFLYTDGVTEAENIDKQLFGDEATLKAVQAASRSTSMEVLVANVSASVHAFAQGTEQSDDITMFALKRLVPDPEPLRPVTEELQREYEKEKTLLGDG